MNRIIKTAVAAAALGLLGVAGTASAKEDIMIVRVGDLNISSHDGAQIALRRIKNAASQFCGPESRDLSTNFAQKRCVKRMTSKAVGSLNAPMVTALYAPTDTIQLAQADTTTR